MRETSSSHLPALGRRELLTGGGALAALSLLWRPATAAAVDVGHGTNVTFDVACLGETFFPDFSSAADLAGGDLRGVTFNVEGDLYPAGAIREGEGQDPDPDAAVGHWFCRGFFVAHPNRPLPHVVTTQEYVLGRITAERTAPADLLVSSGLEGGVTTAVRAVVGGAGRYRGARGDGQQHVIGTNTTVLNEVGVRAPNFRFRLHVTR